MTEAQVERLPAEVAETPELAERRGHELVRQARGPLHEVVGPPTEREVDPALVAEEVGDHRKAAAGGILEEQRRPPGGDHPPVYLGDLEVRVHFRLDLHQLAITAQDVEEGSQVTHRVPGTGGAFSTAAGAWRPPSSSSAGS